jgi:hypothetical protein
MTTIILSTYRLMQYETQNIQTKRMSTSITIIRSLLLKMCFHPATGRRTEKRGLIQLDDKPNEN